MADEFEQFRKRSYHGGYDVQVLRCSETCHALYGGRSVQVRGPPLKRSRSHPISSQGKPRRTLRPTSRQAKTQEDSNNKQDACNNSQTQLELSPCRQEEGHQQQCQMQKNDSSPRMDRLSPKGALNNALHTSLHSLLLLPKINELIESHLQRRIPHHVRTFPSRQSNTSSSKRGSCGKKEKRAPVFDFSTPEVATTGRTPKLSKRTTSLQTSSEASAFRVHIVGQQGVGKATLVRMFAAADEPYTTGTDYEDYSEGASVSVLQNNKEDLMFISADVNSQVDDGKAPIDAYVVVYAVNDKHSFEEASKTVKLIRSNSAGGDVPVVMVANKGDMVRSRVVKTKVGRELAAKYRCKYVEVSALLNINVDELFLGVLTQIYFSREQLRNKASSDSNMAVPRRRPIIRAMGYIGKLFARYREYENDIANLFSP